MFGMKILNFIDGQLFVYFQLFAYFFQISHLEASNTKTAQSKDVWIECLESNYISCGRSLREFPLLFTQVTAIRGIKIDGKDLRYTIWVMDEKVSFLPISNKRRLLLKVFEIIKCHRKCS